MPAEGEGLLADRAQRLGVTGVDLGQAPVAVLGVLLFSGEYSTGLIRSTLAAVPRRGAVLAVKAITLAGVVSATGAMAVLGSLLVGRIVIPDHGFTAARGYPALSLTYGSTLRAAVGSILYLALIALLSLGIATAVRESATSIGIVLGLLYVLPILAEAIGDPRWQRLLQQIGPMSAGLAIQSTTDLSSLPLSPWAGIGVTAAWAAASLLTGGVLLQRRDA